MNELAFSQFLQQLDTLSEKGSTDMIYSLLDQGFIDFPQHISELYYWKAQLYLKLGEYNLAVAELHKGIEKGGWWNPVSLTTKPEWKVLYGYDEFDRIVRHCSHQLEKESKDSKWKLLIKGEQSERALFSIHWKGSNVKDFSQYWSCSNLKMGFLQSSQVHAYHSFNWDQHDIALQDMR
ncbi:hypothetical protein [Ectobacillus polymachus]|uniref:hypothetical protein n=1 Tax=Ectobacillus polymachus TaxID=1508806 RepID=UPI003A894DC6